MWWLERSLSGSQTLGVDGRLLVVESCTAKILEPTGGTGMEGVSRATTGASGACIIHLGVISQVR